jgi:hypothetical protein
MLNKRNKYLLPGLAVILSVVLDIGVSVLGGISFALASIVGLALFYLTTWMFLEFVRLPSKKYMPVAILLGICLLQLPLRLANPRATMVSSPVFVCQLLGVLLGWITYKTSGWAKWSTVVCTILFVGISWKGMDLWLHKMNFGTFTGHVRFRPAMPMTGSDGQGRVVDLASHRGQIVLLDFWYTGCGVCFEKFPEVQRLYDRLKSNPNVVFYAVNRPVPSDTIGQAVQMLQVRNYTFPVLISVDSSMADHLGVFFYPTMIVMDRNQEIIYRGDLPGAEALIAKLL